MSILLSGLNGTGKSTLGRALAAELGYTFIDNEDLFFPMTDPNYRFAAPRSRAEVERMLGELTEAHPNFVFTAVRGDYGEAVVSRYALAVVVEAPREVRLERVYDRSYARFGARMEPGGDLYEREKTFLDMVSARSETYVTEWAKTLRCPVLFVDGTRPVAENMAYIQASMDGIRPYLAEQMRVHPSITPQDLAKLCYQAAHGAEHLLSDLDRARGYLRREFEVTGADENIPLIEPISDSVARVNIAPWKARGLSPDVLFDFFAATATVSGEGDERLIQYLAEAEDWLTRVQTQITLAEWQAFLAWYTENGRPAIHHSGAYRDAEKPAYRIVRRALLWDAGIYG
ncbi:MAG: AAA family ATPase [Clostridia bacterium]|nr:AAA family ATPase [Clostridia bacterium]